MFMLWKAKHLIPVWITPLKSCSCRRLHGWKCRENWLKYFSVVKVLMFRTLWDQSRADSMFQSKKIKASWNLMWKICVCLSIFVSPPHFLIWAEFRKRMPDCPWNLNFLYSKNMKTGSWESNGALTSKDSSLIFQTPVVSLSLEKAFWQPRFAGLTLV